MHPVPDRVKPSFVIFDIWALWRSGLSVRVPRCQSWASECPDVKNYKWRLNPVWHRMHYSCTRMATVGFKELRHNRFVCQTQCQSSSICWRYTILWSLSSLRSLSVNRRLSSCINDLAYATVAVKTKWIYLIWYTKQFSQDPYTYRLQVSICATSVQSVNFMRDLGVLISLWRTTSRWSRQHLLLPSQKTLSTPQVRQSGSHYTVGDVTYDITYITARLL